MKNLLKIFITLVMAAFLLGAGYFLVLSNLSYLLATGKPNFQIRNISSGLLIKTGDWVEKVNLATPIKVFRKNGALIFQSQRVVFTVSTKPKFRIYWKKAMNKIN